MTITIGWMITGISVSGIIGCIVAFFALRKIFFRQRKKMLELIEAE